MIRSTKLSFVVALFLGLINAQVPTTSDFIPKYATPAAQSKINKDMSVAYGTPQFGGENFGGWGGLENYTMGPEGYLNQVKANGVFGIDASNATTNSFWAPYSK